jgi:hypothetical protein
MYLMVKYIRLGPGSLHTGRYDLEPAPMTKGTAT